MHDKRAHTVRAMFSSIAPAYDITNTILSFGIHHIWKYGVARAVPESAERVLDLCTGTGDLIPLLARKKRVVVGADFCYPMLGVAHTRQVQRVGSLVQCDALNMPFQSASFDAVTLAFGARNFAALEEGLREVHRVLAPAGTLVVLEFGTPWLPGFSLAYQWYQRYLMPLIGGMLTGNREAYRYLPETSRAFPSGREFEAVLAKVGFSEMKTTSLSGGIAYRYRASRE